MSDGKFFGWCLIIVLSILECVYFVQNYGWGCYGVIMRAKEITAKEFLQEWFSHFEPSMLRTYSSLMVSLRGLIKEDIDERTRLGYTKFIKMNRMRRVSLAKQVYRELMHGEAIHR